MFTGNGTAIFGDIELRIRTNPSNKAEVERAARSLIGCELELVAIDDDYPKLDLGGKKLAQGSRHLLEPQLIVRSVERISDELDEEKESYLTLHLETPDDWACSLAMLPPVLARPAELLLLKDGHVYNVVDDDRWYFDAMD